MEWCHFAVIKKPREFSYNTKPSIDNTAKLKDWSHKIAEITGSPKYQVFHVQEVKAKIFFMESSLNNIFQITRNINDIKHAKQKNNIGNDRLAKFSFAVYV